ncbi:MAG: hypothetical protein LBQ66_02230 [Planctomycetaceae bacterium]|jgi:diacylglycerol kinase family enzyme|nr:hypothetical protein [Planctomycetaceae bacterium]
MKIIISVNPKAGRSSSRLRAEELFERLQGKGYEAELLTDIDEVADKANRYFSDGELKVLIGVGGDGTAATLVNRTTQGLPITLLSAGTANLISKHFRLGNTPAKLVDIVENGHLVTLDAGKAVSFVEGKSVERIFLVMVSCGLDADIVNGVHSRREERYRSGHKKGAHISYLSYIKPILHSLSTYKYPDMKVEQLIDGNYITVDERTKWGFFFNLNRYGWGLPLAPFAKGNDGKIDHVLFRGGSCICGVFYTVLAQLYVHRFLPNSIAKLGQAEKYRITSASNNTIPFQSDGDPGGCLPIEIEIVKDRFTLLVGKNTKRNA